MNSLGTNLTKIAVNVDNLLEANQFGCGVTINGGNIFINGNRLTVEPNETVNVDGMTVVHNVHGGVTVTGKYRTRRSMRCNETSSRGTEDPKSCKGTVMDNNVPERGYRTGRAEHRNRAIARARSRSELRENSKEEYEEECIICLYNFKDHKDKYFLPCSHYFHKDCVQNWTRISKTCPVCRLELKDI